MRILFIITSLRIGGAERLLVDMLPLLKEQGIEPELLLFDGTETCFLRQLKEKGIKIHIGGNGACQMWNPLHIFKIRKLIKKGEYDILHTHNTPAQLLTAIAIGDKGSPVLITTEHNTTNSRRKVRALRSLDKWMYGKYNKIICVSDKVKETLAEYLKNEKSSNKISVIRNGIDLGRFENIGLKDPSKEKIILMVGAFRKQKDQPTLIKAVSILPEEYRLWLAGGWRGREECEELCRTLNIAERVEFLGERDDIPDLLGKSDIAVLSTHYEGMPLSAIEAMAAGRPLIASDVDGVREIVKDAGILFKEGDYKNLARKIKELGENRKMREEMSSGCHQRASEFDIKTTVALHSSLYRNILNEDYLEVRV